MLPDLNALQNERLVMITQVKSIGFNLPVDVPATAAEFDALAKREGACVTEANNNVLYRSYLAEFRDEFVDALSTKFGIERKTKVTGKTKTGADVVSYDETEVEFVKRVAAAQGVETSAFESLALEVNAKLKFDPSATERKASAPKKPLKKFLEAVATIEATNGLPGLEKAAKNTGAYIGQQVVMDFSTPETTQASREKLALAIKAYADKKADEQVAALGA